VRAENLNLELDAELLEELSGIRHHVPVGVRTHDYTNDWV
jgi:hypothetical protein